MGLDMYLEKRTHVKNWSHAKKSHKFNVKFDGKERKDIKKKRISAIVEDVAYWRKCWGIHNWFVANVQGDLDNCGLYSVGRESLEELIVLCEDVVSGYDDENHTEINEYEAKETIKQLKAILGECKAPEGAYGGDFYYSSSW